MNREVLSVVIQYIVYGAIFVVGLIVLLFLRRRDKRPNMAVAEQKTKELIKDLEKTLSVDEKKGKFIATRMSWYAGRFGDLVVLAESEVATKGNVAYGDVLELYNQAFALFDIESERLQWSEKRCLTVLKTALGKLQKAQEIMDGMKEE